MTFYTRKQVVELLEIDEKFLLELETEAIVFGDAPAGAGGDFSPRMLERARVAHNLVTELEVNLAGAAIILRMREDVADLRRCLRDLAGRVEPRGRG